MPDPNVDIAGPFPPFSPELARGSASWLQRMRCLMKESVHDIRARKEYEAIKGFYTHFMIFVPVMLLLVVIDVVTGGESWAHWVGLGWGLGLAAHA